MALNGSDNGDAVNASVGGMRCDRAGVRFGLLFLIFGVSHMQKTSCVCKILSYIALTKDIYTNSYPHFHRVIHRSM